MANVGMRLMSVNDSSRQGDKMFIKGSSQARVRVLQLALISLDQNKILMPVRLAFSLFYACHTLESQSTLASCRSRHLHTRTLALNTVGNYTLYAEVYHHGTSAPPHSPTLALYNEHALIFQRMKVG